MFTESVSTANTAVRLPHTVLAILVNTLADARGTYLRDIYAISNTAHLARPPRLFMHTHACSIAIHTRVALPKVLANLVPFTWNAGAVQTSMLTAALDAADAAYLLSGIVDTPLMYALLFWNFRVYRNLTDAHYLVLSRALQAVWQWCCFTHHV